MKVTQLLEGAYVVKNKDGVEKRFKNANDPKAQAWKESGKSVEKAKKAERDAQIKAAAEKDVQEDVDLVWSAIRRIQDWEALDWIDLVKMQAVPYLVKELSKNPNKYSPPLRRAVKQAAATPPNDEFDPLLKYFDMACKGAGEGGWKKYARSMTSYGKGAR